MCPRKASPVTDVPLLASTLDACARTAAEVLKQRYGQKADLWSAGILAYQLLSGHLPFAGDSGLAVSKAFMTKQVCHSFNSCAIFKDSQQPEIESTG